MKKVDWIFGRGLSIDSGLGWAVPRWWAILPRDIKIFCIKLSLRRKMGSLVDQPKPIKEFLGFLESRTQEGWKHEFYTTNWDFLLQRAIAAFGWRVRPHWLASSHVWHFNGSVEKLICNSRRSVFVLESDDASRRKQAYESESAYNKIIWGRCIVIVGMSFESDVDKFLLHCLHEINEEVPVGESRWFIVNPDFDALNTVANRVQAALPCAKVDRIQESFNDWLVSGLPQLEAMGVFS